MNALVLMSGSPAGHGLLEVHRQNPLPLFDFLLFLPYLAEGLIINFSHCLCRSFAMDLEVIHLVLLRQDGWVLLGNEPKVGVEDLFIVDVWIYEGIVFGCFVIRKGLVFIGLDVWV